MAEKILLFFANSSIRFFKAYILKLKSHFLKLKNVLKIIQQAFYGFLQKSLHYTLGKPNSLNDYIKSGSMYLSKQFLLKFVLFFCIIMFTVIHYVYPFLRGRIWPAEIVVNTNDFYEFVGKAKVYQKDGNLIYLGMLNKGKAEGQGELYEYDDMVYKGEFSENKYNGVGTLYQNNKKVYQGEFLENQYHGTGVLYDKNENIKFSGIFENGSKKEGVSYFENGKIQYKGNYENDFYGGEGILYVSGSDNMVLYQGMFSQNKYEGKGRLYQEGALLYDGNFSKGLYQGDGILYDSKRGKILYQGSFLNGAYNGVGKLYQSSTSRLLYEGDFLEGKKSGFGTLYSESGAKVYTGNFYNDDIDYKQFINSDLDNIREAFGKETELIMLENHILTVYENLKVAFVFEFSQDGESPTVESIKFFGTQNIDSIKNGMTFYDATEKLSKYDGVEITFDVTGEEAVYFQYCDKQNTTAYAIEYTMNDIVLKLYGGNKQGTVYYFEIGGVTP